jgi:hypothetical protein
MHEAVPYLGNEPHNLLKELGWEMLSYWSQYYEQTQVFKTCCCHFKKIEEMKKAFYADYFSPS